MFMPRPIRVGIAAYLSRIFRGFWVTYDRCARLGVPLHV